MEDYAWFKSYPKGVPHTIDPDIYPSLIELFEESVQKFGNLTAYTNLGVSLTYNEVDRLSKNLAAYLQAQPGLEKGDRVAIHMPNLLQQPIAFFAVIRAGMVVVNTNPLYTPREMEHQFTDSGAKAIIILTNFAYNLEKVLPNTQINTVITSQLGDMLGAVKGSIVNFVVKNVKKMVPAYSLPTAVSLKKALKIGSQNTYKRPSVTGTDIALLQYTGGTTGVAKGAMLTHRNMVANMEQNYAWMGENLKEREEVMITALPLYHIFALTINGLMMFKIGAESILITNPRDMPAFIKELKKSKFTLITGVNTLFNGLLNQPEFKNVDFSKLKIAAGGGMAVQDAVANAWEKVTDSILVEGYGLTECCPVVTDNPLDGTGKIGSIGLPIPSTEIILVDDDKKTVAQGEVGELCVRGPQVMRGYWQRQDETDNVFMNDGWLLTGDMAIMEDDGFFRIVDRKKEMINVSGFNVYPNEIENVIAMMEEVDEVAVVGIPDDKSTEVVKAYIIKKDDSLTVDKIKAFCKENLTGYKVPRQIEFRDELPKSNVGKILRRVLKEEEIAKKA